MENPDLSYFLLFLSLFAVSPYFRSYAHYLSLCPLCFSPSLSVSFSLSPLCPVQPGVVPCSPGVRLLCYSMGPLSMCLCVHVWLSSMKNVFVSCGTLLRSLKASLRSRIPQKPQCVLQTHSLCRFYFALNAFSKAGCSLSLFWVKSLIERLRNSKSANITAKLVP